MKLTRRSLIGKTVFGAGALGLRALATGLPLSFLSRPLQAQDFTCTDKSKAQYLIIATSSAGDPLNANVPGTYAFPEIAHALDPAMAPTDFNLGGTPVKGSKNAITAVNIRRGGRLVQPATQSLDANGGRFIFDPSAFAPTGNVTIELVGRVKTHTCLIEKPVLTLFR